MQNFSPLGIKLREEIVDDIQTDCKTAKFLTTPMGMDRQKVYF